MPAYDKSAVHKVLALVAGIPGYVFGSWPLDVSPLEFLITKVQLTTNVATITGLVIHGDIPLVGALLTVRQTQTAAGAFNVKGIAISAVSINANTGAGTISYALTHAGDVALTNDAGKAEAQVAETSEALVNGASIPVTMPVQDPKTDSARTVSVAVAFPSLPTTATVDLQYAIFDQDSEYIKFGATVATVAGGAVTAGPLEQFTLNMSRFYRLNVSNVTGGTLPTITAKILV